MVRVVEHPLVRHKLALLRDQATPPAAFRALVGELAQLLLVEVARDWRVEEVTVRTPLAETVGHRLREDEVAVVAVLRAGLAMAEGITRLLPGVRIGHVGLYRDEATLRPVVYYHRLPAWSATTEVLLVDPMLATGGSVVAALDLIHQPAAGRPQPARVRVLSLIAAPEGIEAVRRAYGEVEIVTAAVDQRLDHRGYIVPGLGDAGDRMFAT